MLEDALEHLVKGIVDHPEDVTVDLLTNRRGKTLEIRVHPDDLGKVIGRGGGRPQPPRPGAVRSPSSTSAGTAARCCCRWPLRPVRSTAPARTSTPSATPS